MNPITQLKLIIAAVVLVVAGFFVWNYNHMQNRIEDLKAQQKSASEQISQLKSDSKVLETLVLDKLKSEQVIRHEREIIHTNLTETKRNDPKSASYLDTRIPDGVRKSYGQTRE